MVIFDLDQTLIDTSPVEQYRRPGGWGRVMEALPNLPIYDGVGDLIGFLSDQKETIAIVTKSPDMVPKALVKLYKWPIKIIVGAHDVKPFYKPHPRGLLMAIEQAGARREDTIHIGDKPEDTEASRRAKVMAIGAAWGAPDRPALEASKPDHLFDKPSKLLTFLTNHFR